MSLTSESPEPPNRYPWRSARLGWLVAVAALVAGVPLFLRMPLWCDVSLYDMVARTLLCGGVHYRDVFDTNLPGFPILLTAVRWLFGFSSEAVRAVDLVVVGVTTFMLLRWTRATGATAAGVAWLAAGVAAFYPFLSEFCHAQRDVWMMVPAVGAAWYRLRRVERAKTDSRSNGWLFRTGIVEGAAWGVAAWIKPHIIFVAAACWFTTAARLAGSSETTTGKSRARRVGADLAGAVVGGLLVIALGVTWLVASGSWPYLVDVFTNWNTAYVQKVNEELGERLGWQLGYFPTWSVWFLLAVPVAVGNLIAARVWSPQSDADAPQFGRALLAALYLGWAGMALFFQKHYHYVHVPETLLMMAVFASNRWAVVPFVLAWQAVASVWLVCVAAARGEPLVVWDTFSKKVNPACVMWVHPAFNPCRAACWADCFCANPPRQFRNNVGLQWHFHAGVDEVQLGEVEDFLRSQKVRDSELVCWHDAPHVLYLRLGLKQPIRFMHLGTAVGLGEWQHQQVRAELRRAAPRVRFAVSDVLRVMEDHTHIADKTWDGLPPDIQEWQRGQFPFDQPVVFRSSGGRYRVHAVIYPIGDCRIPRGIGTDY